MILRQAVTWDPLLQCCSAWTWIDISLNYKLQRIYEEIKITMCLCSWGKLQAKSYKKTKIRKQSHYWEARNKTGCWEQKLDTVQALHTANVLSFQLCTALSDNMDCSSPGSPVHWILQARIVELPRPPPRDLPDAGIEHTANGWANHLSHPSV